MDLHAPLDHIVDPIQVAEALERMRIVLLSKLAEDLDARHRMSSTLCELYNTQGNVLAGEAHGLRRGHGLSATGLSRI
jgi:hypothetical protein